MFEGRFLTGRPMCGSCLRGIVRFASSVSVCLFGRAVPSPLFVAWQFVQAYVWLCCSFSSDGHNCFFWGSLFGSGLAQVRFASCLVRVCTLVFSPCFRFLVVVSRSEELSLSKSRDITSQTWVPLRESSVPSTSMVLVWLRLASVFLNIF